LKTDAYELLKELKVIDKLNGWRYILSDMSLNNEIYETCTINMPKISAYNLDNKEWFTFAGFYPPGYH